MPRRGPDYKYDKPRRRNCKQTLTGKFYRWLWPVLYLAHRITSIRRPKLPEAAPGRQRRAQAGDCRHTRLERQVPNTRGVGKGQGKERHRGKAANGRDGWGTGTGHKCIMQRGREDHKKEIQNIPTHRTNVGTYSPRPDSAE